MLTDSQRKSFAEDGFLIVEGLLDEDKVLHPLEDEYEQILDDLCLEWVAQGRLSPPVPGARFVDKLLTAYQAGCDWFQPMDISLPGDRITTDTPMHFGPAVFDLIRTPKLLDLVEDFVGPEISSTPIQHVRIKVPSCVLQTEEPRAHLTVTHWHQDRGVAHAEADRTRMVTVWCAVTDATEENGCLQVIRGGHRAGLLPHLIDTQPAIEQDKLDLGAVTSLPVKRGGVVFLDPLIPHASLPNVSDGIRWSFDIRYHKTGEPSGRAHFPEFVARSRRAPETELKSWRDWRAMWEDARARLALAPHIEIHRWPKVTAPS